MVAVREEPRAPVSLATATAAPARTTMTISIGSSRRRALRILVLISGRIDAAVDRVPQSRGPYLARARTRVDPLVPRAHRRPSPPAAQGHRGGGHDHDRPDHARCGPHRTHAIR